MKIISAFALLIIIFLFSLKEVEAFRLNGPKKPTTDPPFLYWDLRRFDGCGVPYTVLNSPVSTGFPQPAPQNEAAVVTEVDAAAGSWNDVKPAIVTLFHVPKTQLQNIPNPSRARDNYNVIFWDGSNGTEDPADDLQPINIALTRVWYDGTTGRINEADIEFNDRDYDFIIGPNDGKRLVDIQGVMAHEFGHFIGLDETNIEASGGTTPTMFKNVTPFVGNVNQRSLEEDDKDAANFLYTPDLGDAPDGIFALIGRYPSFVHSGFFDTLHNEQSVHPPLAGAAHLFGILKDGDGNMIDRDKDGRPDYQYEWLGKEVNDDPDECEAMVTDKDKFDDGVKFRFNNWGMLIINVEVTINDVTIDGVTHSGNRYLNAWFDYNRDGIWETPNEKIIGTNSNGDCDPSSTQIFTTSETRTYLCVGINKISIEKEGHWLRFRLDYKEDVGRVKKFSDLELSEDQYAASYGEVEDYILRPTLIQLNYFTAEVTDGIVSLSWTTGAEIDNEGFNILRSTFPNGPYVRINPTIIPAKAISPGGATYSSEDTTVVNGIFYYYKLEEVDTHGYVKQYGPVAALRENIEDETTEANVILNAIDQNSKETTHKEVSVVSDEREKTETTYIIPPSIYTIQANAAASINFLSGESVDKETVQGIIIDAKQTIKKYIGEKVEVSEKELGTNLSVETLSRGVDDAKITVIEKYVSSLPTILFRIIDPEGYEIAVASIDVNSEGSAFGENAKTKSKNVTLQKRWNKDGIILTWDATEPVKGFHILRSMQKDGSYQKINKTPIPYIGSGLKGQVFRYTYSDIDIQKGENYYYKLEVIKKEGGQTASR